MDKGQIAAKYEKRNADSKQWRKHFESGDFFLVDHYRIPIDDRKMAYDFLERMLPKKVYGDGLQTFSSTIRKKDALNDSEYSAAEIFEGLENYLRLDEDWSEPFSSAVQTITWFFQQAGIVFENARQTFLFEKPDGGWEQAPAILSQQIYNYLHRNHPGDSKSWREIGRDQSNNSKKTDEVLNSQKVWIERKREWEDFVSDNPWVPHDSVFFEERARAYYEWRSSRRWASANSIEALVRNERFKDYSPIWHATQVAVWLMHAENDISVIISNKSDFPELKSRRVKQERANSAYSLAYAGYLIGLSTQSLDGKQAEYIAEKKIKEASKNRAHGALGGQGYSEKMKFARGEAELIAKRSKADWLSLLEAAAKARAIRKACLSSDRRKDTPVFVTNDGRPLSVKWFKDLLSEWASEGKLTQWFSEKTDT